MSKEGFSSEFNTSRLAPQEAVDDIRMRITRDGPHNQSFYEEMTAEQKRTFLQRTASVVKNIAAAGAVMVASPQESAEPQSATPFSGTASEIEALAKAAADLGLELRVEFSTEAVEPDVEASNFNTELQKRMEWWLTDMKTHFASALELSGKPVVGAENLTREEYIRTKTEFNEHSVWGDLPQETQSELRRLLPALAIQESGYHNGLVSKDDAVGLLQQIPDAIDHLSGYTVTEVQQSLTKQVEVAGNYFINARYVMFDSVKYGMGDVARDEIMRRHSSEELNRELLPLLLINGYNVGPAGMAGVVKQYFAVPEHRENELTGKELFFDIIEWAYACKEGAAADFGQDARNYVPKIYAAAALLDARKETGSDRQPARVHYNF